MSETSDIRRLLAENARLRASCEEAVGHAAVLLRCLGGYIATSNDRSQMTRECHDLLVQIYGDTGSSRHSGGLPDDVDIEERVRAIIGFDGKAVKP